MKLTTPQFAVVLAHFLALGCNCAAQQYNFTTFAGAPSGAGYADGAGNAARFRYPSGVAVDSAENVYVADTWNHTIRKVTRDGVVSTLAGLADERGSADGAGVARFDAPHGLAVDNSGNVYVADYYGCTIRKITPGGFVSTLAGLPYKRGSEDGSGGNARFAFPSGVALDSSGNIYVADYDNATIRKITPDGLVSTLAGKAGNFGNVDGSAHSARFFGPSGLALDQTGNIYVADSYNNAIRKITPDGLVSTLGGHKVGAEEDWMVFYPQSVVVDGNGNVFVSDYYNPVIWMITPAGLVTTLAGLVGRWGSADGIGTAARFSVPLGLTVDSANNIYVADYGDSTIRKITASGAVNTLAGRSGGYPGDDEGIGSAARFALPTGIALDNTGNVYVADTLNKAIRKITPAGLVSTLADLDGNGIPADHRSWTSQGPHGVAVDSTGNVYVADTSNGLILKITPTGMVSTLAGSIDGGPSVDGTGAQARFSLPRGIAVDSADYIYVADTYSHTIRKITPTGIVSTLAGLAGASGHTDGTGSSARFGFPMGVAVDKNGNIYVADTESHTIRKITANGFVTTLAGLAGNSGTEDGQGSAARFGWPTGVAVDSAGNLYVAEGSSLAFEQGFGHATIRKITPDGMVTTIAGQAQGQAQNYGSQDGTGSMAFFTDPTGVAVDSAGNIYVTDTAHSTVRLGKPLPVTQPLLIAESLFQKAGRQILLQVVATTNQLVLIQAASELRPTNWNTIHSVTLWNGRSTLTIPGSSNLPRAFYRAISPLP